MCYQIIFPIWRQSHPAQLCHSKTCQQAVAVTALMGSISVAREGSVVGSDGLTFPQVDIAWYKCVLHNTYEKRKKHCGFSVPHFFLREYFIRQRSNCPSPPYLKYLNYQWFLLSSMVLKDTKRGYYVFFFMSTCIFPFIYRALGLLTCQE